MQNILKRKATNITMLLFCLIFTLLVVTGCQENTSKFQEVVLPDTPTVLFMARYKSESGNYRDNGFFIYTDGSVYDIEYSNSKTPKNDILCPENNKKISEKLEAKMEEIRKTSKPKTSIDQLKIKELLSLGQRIDTESEFNTTRQRNINAIINRYAFFVSPETKVATLCAIEGKDEGKIADPCGNKFASETYIVFEQIEGLQQNNKK